MPQIMGSGAALFDFDNDGRLDVYLVHNGGPRGSRNQLFRQNRDGKFTDVSAGSGLDVAGFGMGVSIGDVDNDGLADVYLAQYGSDRLFLNQGRGHFKEVTRDAGIDNPLWGTSASFCDYDRDGWLDLVVVNYLAIDENHPCNNSAGQPDYCHPSNFPGTITRLFHNRGRDSKGTWLGFEDRSVPAGLATRPGPGLGVLCADFTGDGWPDIFVANDDKPNHLWVNQKNGTFKEEAASRGLAYNALGRTQGNMGVALGDIDGDGLNDLFVTHLASEFHSLWKQGPRGWFQDAIASTGLNRCRWRGTGFGTVLADFDHDAALDLAIVNGAVFRPGPREGKSHWAPYSQRNQVFAGSSRGTFRDLSLDNPDFCAWSGVSRGLAVGDFDGDGALDLLVTQIAGPARLFRNVAADKGHWLVVRALVPCGRDAIGAEVVVEADQTLRRLVQPGFSYLCSNDPQVHFGLGKATSVKSIQVNWPDGSRESFPGGGVNRGVRLIQGKGKPLPESAEGKK